MGLAGWQVFVVAMWLCGPVALVAMWLCGYVAMWLCRLVAIWLLGYVATLRIPQAVDAYKRPIPILN